MTPDQFASSRVHALLAELIELGMFVSEKAVGKAVSKEHGIQVVLFVTPYEPMHIDHVIWPTEPKPPGPAGPRPPVCECIMEAAPKADEKPITMRQLAKLSGYSYSDHFRKSVDALVKAGELVRYSRGFRRAPKAG